MPRIPTTDPNGFSLVDALIASLILAAALASLAQLVVVAATANDVAGRSTIATLLAADKIEEVRGAPATSTGVEGTDLPRPGFTRDWSVSAVPNAPLSLAIVQVSVRTRDGETRMFAVTPQGAP